MKMTKKEILAAHAATRDAKFEALFDKLVPNYGPADTVAGEALRACNRLYREYYVNGERYSAARPSHVVSCCGAYLTYRTNEEIKAYVRDVLSQSRRNYYTLIGELTDLVLKYAEKSENLTKVNSENSHEQLAAH